MLEHHAGRTIHHDLADHRRREHHGQGQRIVLKHPGNIVTDRLLGLLEITRDLVVGTQIRRRRDHDAGGAGVHRGLRQRAHGSKAGRGDADDDLHVLGTFDEANCNLLGFGRIQLRRLAENAEHGDAVAADFGVEVGQPVDGLLVDAAVIVERRRRDREGACGLGGELGHADPRFSFVIPGRCVSIEPGISRFRVRASRAPE